MKKITSKHILPVLLTLAAMLPGQKAAADSSISHGGQSYTLFDSEGCYTATAGSATPTTYTYEYLVDNVNVPQWAQQPFLYTYWMTDDDYGFTTKFVEFHSAAPIVVKGYRLRTGCNTKDYPNRRPRNWTLKGKKHENDANWTVLATETNAQLPRENEQEADYWLTSNTSPYQYFRFEVTAIQGPETIQVTQNISYNRWRMELSELQIIGNNYSANTDLDYATIEDLQHYYKYTGNNITPSFTVKNMSGTALTVGTDYIVSYSPGTPNATGNYTLTITGKSPYTGQKTASFKVVNTLSGAGTSGNPYIIADANDWYIFGKYINEDEANVSDKYYKLADDFNNSNEPITEMIATDASKPFCGTLDGNGRTLHIALTASTEDGCAPFRYLKGATIKNLTVAGTATTSSKFGASIAVDNLDAGEYTTYITDCYSTVTIASSIKDQYGNAADGTNGGFVGVNHGRLNFSRCAFRGRMLGRTAQCNGGFVGWNDNGAKSLSFSQCVFDPVIVTVSEDYSKTFSRYGTNAPSFDSNMDSYFTYAGWSTDQGTRVYQVTLDEYVTVTRTKVDTIGSSIVTYYTDGITSNGIEYYKTDADVTLHHVAREGYVFAGYKINGENTNEDSFKMSGQIVTVTTQWTPLENVTLTAKAATVSGEAKYVTTFFNGTLDFRLPAGALAYTVKKNGENLEFYRIGPESNVIPKGTAVVIIADKASDAATKELTLTLLNATTVAVAEEKNDLKGSDTVVDCNDDKYVLGISEGNLGFYKYSGNSIPAGKAYMNQ